MLHVGEEIVLLKGTRVGMGTLKHATRARIETVQRREDGSPIYQAVWVDSKGKPRSTWIDESAKVGSSANRTRGQVGATSKEMATIRAQRIDDTARKMQRVGVFLDWEQVESLGEMRVAWLANRLGLQSHTDERGVTFKPQHREGEDNRVGGARGDIRWFQARHPEHTVAVRDEYMTYFAVVPSSVRLSTVIREFNRGYEFGEEPKPVHVVATRLRTGNTESGTIYPRSRRAS